MVIAAALREAGRQADFVAAFLESIGIHSGPHQTCGLPADSLFKLGALLKLYQWDRAGLLPHITTPLPTWEEVYCDFADELQGQRPRFSGEELNRLVLQVFLRSIAWTPWEGRLAEVALVQQHSSDELLDRLARVLWNYRHLAKGQT